MIRSLNPATGALAHTFEPLSDSAINDRLARAAAAARKGPPPLSMRVTALRRLAELLLAERRQLGELMTMEMGKPISAAIAEAEKCASCCTYYADHAEPLTSHETPVPGDPSWIAYQPLGVVLAVMPWNFPFWQVIRFAAPALLMGNVGLLKHASNVPQCALAIEDLIRRAGFPEGSFQTLLIESGAVERIVLDERVAAVTLTGSEGAGRAVASAAGQVLKKTVLELGGSDPFVVLPSASLADAVRTAVTARMINNGQSCIAAKRFIVHQDIAEDFTTQFVARVNALRVGDPMHDTTDIGPLATKEIRDTLHEQVQKSVAIGARVLTGGEPIEGQGFYYEPTVLADVPLDAPAACEELFGPVAPIFIARDYNDAVRLANDTPFGLGAACWSQDEAELRRFAGDVAAGTVALNGMVASDPRYPFGGVKRSGYGRELGYMGAHEFVNVKTVRMTLPSLSSSHDTVRTGDLDRHPQHLSE